MATDRQVRAAKRNVRTAQRGARKQRTIANLPKSTRRELRRQRARGRTRGGEAGRALEDRDRQQLYEIATDKDIRGRSKMGTSDLIRAIGKAR